MDDPDRERDEPANWPDGADNLIEALLALVVIALLMWLGLGHPGVGR
jgi:hypothetical protein